MTSKGFPSSGGVLGCVTHKIRVFVPVLKSAIDACSKLFSTLTISSEKIVCSNVSNSAR